MGIICLFSRRFPSEASHSSLQCLKKTWCELLFVLGRPTVTGEVKGGGQRSRTRRQSFARVLPRAGTDVCSSVRGDCTLVSGRAQVARPHQGTQRRGNPWFPGSQPQQEDPRFVLGTETGGCGISRVASGLDKENIDSHANALKIQGFHLVFQARHHPLRFLCNPKEGARGPLY